MVLPSITLGYKVPMPSLSIEKDWLGKTSKVQSPSSGQGDIFICKESVSVAFCLEAHEKTSKKRRNKYKTINMPKF